MPKYILDTNIFLDAEKTYYSPEWHPGFWDYLDLGIRHGVLVFTRVVYDEIVVGNDSLVNWVKQRKTFAKDYRTSDVQKNYFKIAEYVAQWTNSAEAPAFLNSADPWIIALAMTNPSDYKIVTNEKREVNPRTKFPKIPRLCENFKCPCINLHTLLEETKPIFILDNEPFK